MLIDEPVQVWEQQHFNFPASYRTIRELILPIGVTADYDSDLNADHRCGYPSGAALPDRRGLRMGAG